MREAELAKCRAQLACEEAELALKKAMVRFLESDGRLSVDAIGDFRPALERVRSENPAAITAKIEELKAEIKQLKEDNEKLEETKIKELEKEIKALRSGEGERDKGSLPSSAQRNMQSAPSHHVCPLLLSGSRCRRSRLGTRLVLVKSFCFLVCLFMPCAFHFFYVLQSAAKCACVGLSEFLVYLCLCLCRSPSVCRCHRLSFCVSLLPPDSGAF
jgi:hypothetical protein